MTQYLSSKPFSVHPGAEPAYRENYDKVFGKKRPKHASKKIAAKKAKPKP